MRRVLIIAVVVACVFGAAHAQSYRACLDFNSVRYDIMSDPSGTVMKRYNGAALIDTQTYAAFHLPAAGTTTWDEGVAFAATMQTRNAWLNNEPTSRATWQHSASSDVWTIYTTVNGVPNQFEFTKDKCGPAPPAPNCMSASNAFGVFCNANEDCCGADSMNPQCIPKNSGIKCCVHYKAAAACTSSQACCGAYGTGASSSAFCCETGSTCCHAQLLNHGAACCPTGKTCCQSLTQAFCCAANEVCNSNGCQKPAPNVPTPAPVINQGCISNNGWFYRLRSDNSGATLDRYQGSTFVDRQTFAAFNRPAAGTTAWGQGVEFASAMQSRNAWLNTEATSSASWFEDGSTGNDRFTFVTTVGGQPVQYVFATEACV